MFTVDKEKEEVGIKPLREKETNTRRLVMRCLDSEKLKVGLVDGTWLHSCLKQRLLTWGP